MRICIPSQDDQGLRSEVHEHFGSAPWFTFADTESSTAKPVPNPSCHHHPGSCQHIPLLRGRQVEAVVGRGIGRKACQSLREEGIEVYASEKQTVGEVLEELASGQLVPMDFASACTGGFRRGGGRGHHHHGEHAHH
jgi:predicted Fe-Mo cluster-binding NifX family protein